MRSKSAGLTIFLIGILVSSLAYSSLILDFTLTPRLISIAIVILIVLFLILQSKQKITVKLDVILTSYSGFVIFSCLSVLWAHTSSEAIFENSKVIIAFFVFLLAYYAFKKEEEHMLNLLCKISILIVIIELVFVVFQLSRLTVFNKEALYNVYGINSHKNLLSSYLFINLFFLMLGFIRMQKGWKYLSLFCLVLTIAMIIVIQTKAVWIALVISFLLFCFLLLYKRINIRFNFKWILIILLVMANVFFVLIQPKIIERGLAFNQSQIETNKYSGKTELDNERLELWKKTYYMINHYPLMGVGLGNWQIYFPDATLKGMYRAEDLNYTFQRPHNDLLWIIAEIGFIGFNLFLIFIFSVLLLLIQSIRILQAQKKLTISFMLCIISIIGFYTASFFDFPKERIEHLIWMNIIFGYAYYLIKKNNSLKIISEFKLSTFYFLLAIAIVLFVVVIGCYRYKGEYYTRKMYDQKKLSNNSGVIREGKNAMNFAYSIDPTSLPIKWYTGNSYALLGNFYQSKIDFTEAYKVNPYNRNVLNDLASACVNSNDTALAKKYYIEACRISPRFDDSKLNLTAIYFNQKQFSKADSVMKTLLHDSERRTQYQKMINAFLGK